MTAEAPIDRARRLAAEAEARAAAARDPLAVARERRLAAQHTERALRILAARAHPGQLSLI